MTTFVAFRLKPGRDDALIDWINNLPEQDRSYHIREALRSNLQGQVITSRPIEINFAKPEVRSLPPLPGDAEDVEAALDDWLDV